MDKIFLVDIDDTLVDFSNLYARCHFALFGEEISREAIDNRLMCDFVESGLVLAEDMRRVFEFMNVTNGHQQVQLFPHANDFMNELRASSKRIFYITRRHESIRELTYKMLKDKALPLPSNVLASSIEDKLSLLMAPTVKSKYIEMIKQKNPKCELIYIENDPEDVLASAEIVDRVFTFNYSYSKDVVFPKNVTVVREPSSGGLMQIINLIK